MYQLDETDLQILAIMQQNARISNADLAREVNLAPSAVLERVKKLEAKQILVRYNATVNPLAVGQKLLAFVFIKSKESSFNSKTAIALAKIPEVQEVHTIAGDDCFLVKIRTQDAASLMALMRSSLKKIPDIISTRTTIVLETHKEEQQIIIPLK